jgi:hypothetical protein
MLARLLFTGMLLGLLLPGCQQGGQDDYQVLNEADLVQQEPVETVASPDETGIPETTPPSEAPAQPAVMAQQPDEELLQAAPPGDAGSRPAEFLPPADLASQTAGSDAATTLQPASPDAVTPAGTVMPASLTEDPLLTELPQEIKLLIPHKVFVPEGDALRVTFDDIDLLKVLNMQKVPLDAVDHMPDWLKGLSGKKVTLRGWMYPPASQEGIRRFIFVRDNGVCCFGPKAKIYDKVAVTLKEGSSTSVIQGHAFDVTGTFTVEADILDDELMFLYFMDDCVISGQ